MVFDFEKEKLIAELKKRKPKKVLVQLPEGIKKEASKISKLIEALGIEVIFSGQTCWGACSLAYFEAKALGVDLIVHFGHAEFLRTDIPVLYIEIKDILNLNFLLEKSLEYLKKYKTIGFSYSIQHRHELEKIQKFYENKNKKIILSKKLGKIAYEGHILGCQYEGLKAIEKKVNCFLILGNEFHSIGAALAVKKPVFLIDVYNNKIKTMEGIKEKVLKQRAIAIEKLKEAKNVGIISEIKLGQLFGSAKYLVEKLKKQNKNVISISMDELTPEKIMNFYDIDVFIELACPRIALDDSARYSKPILTFKEALVAIGEKSWKELLESGLI
ncbi:diphthamide biosynthesis enzyme Dph2 [Candidatus Pacearchaeota archaeon]|nr:diphthamide biosynthesis enzyme Dph2 [Candidatus Pacearchaeota archaeon]